MAITPEEPGYCNVSSKFDGEVHQIDITFTAEEADPADVVKFADGALWAVHGEPTATSVSVRVTSASTKDLSASFNVSKKRKPTQNSGSGGAGDVSGKGHVSQIQIHGYKLNGTELMPRATTSSTDKNYYALLLPHKSNHPTKLKLKLNKSDLGPGTSQITLSVPGGVETTGLSTTQWDASAFPDPVEFTSRLKENITVPQVFTATFTTEKGGTVTDTISLLPIEFEIKHTETDPATGQALNPGTDTMLRDEIVDIRIKIPPINNADWTVDLSIEPDTMRNQSLPNRGNVQMYDFGQIETNGAVTPDKTQFVLQASTGGERTIRAVFNKEGTLKIKMKSPDGKIDFTSPEYFIQKRIRKYANLPSSQNHDLNQHDQSFIDAAAYWGGVYQHAVDDVERLKAMGMAESDLGITDSVDILTVGNNDDFVIPRLKGLTSGVRLNGTTATWTKEFEFLPNGPGGYYPSYYNYQDASKVSASIAIKWGVCWLFKKATTSGEDPNNPPIYAKFDGWRTWDSATSRYNGGGVSNYLERVNRAMKEGRHPTTANLYLWPLKSNKKARGDQ